eukprot:6057279-Karenia_brevis.AAC.1
MKWPCAAPKPRPQELTCTTKAGCRIHMQLNRQCRPLLQSRSPLLRSQHMYYSKATHLSTKPGQVCRRLVALIANKIQHLSMWAQEGAMPTMP